MRSRRFAVALAVRTVAATVSMVMTNVGHALEANESCHVNAGERVYENGSW